LSASHPELVDSAVSQVLEQSSVATAQVSNTAPRRTHERDGSDALPPPLLGRHRRKTSGGEMQPVRVNHESMRR